MRCANSIPRKDKIQICRIYIIWAFICAFTLKQISRRQREAGNSFGSLLASVQQKSTELNSLTIVLSGRCRAHL